MLVYCCFYCGDSVFIPFFCFAVIYAISSFAIIMMEKRELVALLSLSSWLVSCYCYCPVTLPYDTEGWSAVCDCGIS